MSLVTTLRNKFFTIGVAPDVTGSWNWQLYGETNYGEGTPFTHFKIDNNQLIYGDSFDGDVVVYTPSDHWTASSYRYIYIGEGADVDNSDAINWFQINATEYIPTYNLSYNMSHLTITDYGGGQAPATVQYDGSVDLKLHPDVDYGLPSSITVNGDCNYTYRSSDGAIFIENIRSNISVSATGIFHRVYDINMTLTHLIYTGDTTVETDGTASGTLIPSGAYFLPETVQVTGCSYTYDKNTGAITFSNPPHSSTGVYLIAVGSPIDTRDLTLILYNNQAERIQANKIPKLTFVKTVQGTLREQSSIVKPSITMEYDHVPEFNYVYIPNFSRYYYVNNITSVSTNIWRIDLSVDVLMTYYTDYRELTGIVKRQENSYNNKIIDTIRPTSNNPLVNVINPSINGVINIEENKTRYLVSLRTNTSTGTWNNFRKSFISNNKVLISEGELNKLLADLNDNDLFDALKNLFNGDIMQAFISLRAYPFDLYNMFSYYTTLTPATVYFGTRPTTASGYYVPDVCDNYPHIFLCGEFDFTGAYTWIDTTANYSLYIPYYGFTDLNFDDVKGKYLSIQYLINFDTGHSTVVLKSGTTSQNLITIKTLNCVIGIDIPLTRDNSEEIARNYLSSSLNAVMSAASGNFGGALSKIAEAALSVRFGSESRGSIGGPYEAMYIATQPFIIKTTPDYITPTNYGHLHGYPSMQSAQLKTLTGYTVMDEIHVEDIPNITEAEQTELETILKSGFIM